MPEGPPAPRLWPVLAILTVACGACLGPANKGAAPAPEIGFKEAAAMEWKGLFCGVLQGSHRVLSTAADWRQAWADAGQAAPPTPDFKAYFAVIVFLGQRNTGGYGVRWTDPESSGATTVARYRIVTPRGLSIQVLTQPYAVKLFPRTAPEIRVEALPE